MKKIALLLVFATWSVSFSQSKNTVPTVYSNEKYEVETLKNVVYGKGLTNNTSPTEMPLKLDVFMPKRKINNKPAILLIHGGGFTGGSKEHTYIVAMANYFASRGWVAFSIDYRLQKHQGTVPQNFKEFVNKNIHTRPERALAVYPANRDAKAALRWVYANAEKFGINTNYITVGGGSAGAIIAVQLGCSDKSDYTNELSLNEDPTLKTTNLEHPTKVHTILDFWGGPAAVIALGKIKKEQKFDSQDAPIMIVHGTKDPTVSFKEAMALKKIYTKTGVPYEFYPIKGKGHGLWQVKVNGKSLSELSLDFIITQQRLNLL